MDKLWNTLWTTDSLKLVILEVSQKWADEKIRTSASPSFPHPHPGKPIFIYQKPMRIVQMTLMVQALIVVFCFFWGGTQAPDLSFDCQVIHFKEAPTSQNAAQPGKAPGYLPGLWHPQFRHIGWFWWLTILASCLFSVLCFQFLLLCFNLPNKELSLWNSRPPISTLKRQNWLACSLSLPMILLRGQTCCVISRSYK